MLSNNMYLKKIIYIIIVLYIVISIYSIYIAFTRLGKIKVTIDTIPTDSTITINNKNISSGDIYLEPGTYTLKAKRVGFSDDSFVVKVKSKPQKIALLPEPKSDTARKWINDNPDIQTEREVLGGYMSNIRGEYIKNTTPIVDILPYSDTDGPFSINYGYRSTRDYGTFLSISNTTAEGREASLQWIRESGYDPTDFEIVFKDYKNPLDTHTEGGL